MHPFGGTPICPRCDKAVYAAEQVMGPGRKLYHKPCLACTICNKRLDSYTLLEHDLQPFCKSCHMKNFGTKDLRHANLPHREGSPPPSSSPTRANFSFVQTPIHPSDTGTTSRRFPSPVRPTFTGSNGSSQRFPSPIRPLSTGNGAGGWLKPTRSLVTSPTSPSFPSHTPTPPILPSDSPQPVQEETKEETVTPEPQTEQEEEEALDTFDSAPLSSPVRPRPLSHTFTADLLKSEGLSPLVQSATGTSSTRPFGSPLQATPTGSRYGAALGGTISVNLTGTPTGASPARKWNVGTPVCPRCAKNVYFAEQVKAVGKTFHKNCLRCTECNTLLDSSRLRDHDGDPVCVRCYGKAYSHHYLNIERSFFFIYCITT
ncbi:hypothetical protein BDQ12DRAFT_632297 [Crucibulum laeve]|uniref:LIM zinc-binding domain-containing protein n=1 Tax=Crucibulum laeve TaxID=68775 RepID=A0A5C3LXW3_9AGAR|nr:hypothetical protein BDQ12DRAFT_632297 [Crucibulum laeve]